MTKPSETTTTKGFEFIQGIIQKRWVPEIIYAIHHGMHTYTAILESIPFLSKTELNRKLALLQDQKVIEKTGSSLRPYYHLLPLGHDLEHIFRHFEAMGEKYQNTP